MRRRIAMLLAGVIASLGLTVPPATAASDPTHSSCVAQLTSYFKFFGMTGQVGPLFSSVAQEDPPLGQTTIRDRARVKGACD